MIMFVRTIDGIKAMKQNQTYRNKFYFDIKRDLWNRNTINHFNAASRLYTGGEYYSNATELGIRLFC